MRDRALRLARWLARPGPTAFTGWLSMMIWLVGTFVLGGWMQVVYVVFGVVFLTVYMHSWYKDRQWIDFLQQRREAEFQATLKRVFDRGGRYN